MECQYCKNKFISNSSLKAHQKKAKYCLQKQGKQVSEEFTCEFCNSVFTVKAGLQYHYKICRVNKCTFLTEIDQLKKQCNEYINKNILLEKELNIMRMKEEELKKDKENLMADYAKLAAISANKSTTTTNTTNNNNLNLSVFDKTPAEIKRIVEEKYDKNYLVDGQKGVARFAHLHVLKNEDITKPPIYLITDKSRGNAKYKISDTEVVTDIGMTGLTKKIHPSIKKKAILIAADDNFENQEVFDGYQEVFNMDDDNGIFRKELIKILENTEE